MKQKQIISNNIKNARLTPADRTIVRKLVGLNKLAAQIHDETTHDAIAKLFGMKRQAISYHAKKEEEK